MRALAAFVMSSRRNAIIAAMILGIMPVINILSAPVVALVCLRQGAVEGLKVLVWALLPTIAWMQVGEIFPFAILVGTYCLALVLRSTDSWELTLSSSVLVGLAALAYVYLNPLFFERMGQVIEVLQASPDLQGEVFLQDKELLLSQLAFWFSFVAALFCILMLMLARYWQAGLYKPGGFQIEFRQIRLGKTSAAILLALTGLGLFGGGYLTPLLYSALPLLVAGLGLMHGIIALKRWPVAALVILYITLLSPYTLSFLIVAAVMDSSVDFRKRFSQQ